jgi:glycosyltransferase involved in cell wall biosynthesis
MRICLIAPIPPFRGGIAKYCYSLAQELDKRHELLLLSYQKQYPELLYGRRSQVDSGCDRERIRKEFRNLSYEIDSTNPFSWLRTAEDVSRFKPDVVILPWWVTYWVPMYLYLLHALRKKGIRVIFLCINVFEHEDNPVKNFLTRLVLGRVDALIVHSEQEKNEIRSFNPKAHVKSHLLPLFEYPVEQTVRQYQTLHLLFFGFVRPYKGLDILLRAVGILRSQRIALKVVGEFWHDKNDYLRLVEELNIADKVEIIDQYVPDHEMGNYFAEADLVVLPYRKTKTSGIIATAYGFGKPVLATNVGGFHEVVKDGYTGKIVAPSDPQAIANGIMWFLDRRQVNFTANIAEFAAQRMSWSSLVDMIEKISQGPVI